MPHLSIPPTSPELDSIQNSLRGMPFPERSELSLDLTDFASDIYDKYPEAARAVMRLANIAGS